MPEELIEAKNVKKYIEDFLEYNRHYARFSDLNYKT